MKTSIPLLPILFGATLATQNTTASKDTQRDLSALTQRLEELAGSFLSTALDRLDEREKCARENGERPTCTRDNVVLRKE